MEKNELNTPRQRDCSTPLENMVVEENRKNSRYSLAASICISSEGQKDRAVDVYLKRNSISKMEGYNGSFRDRLFCSKSKTGRLNED